MRLIKVIELIEILLLKKNNFSINIDEELLIEELFCLIVNIRNLKNEADTFECNCELNSETIEKEIEINKCLDCGFPLSVL